MTNHTQEMSSTAMGQIELITISSLLLLLSLLCVASFASLNRQSAANEAMLQELIHYQTEPRQGAASVAARARTQDQISHQTKSISFEYLSEMNALANEGSNGAYITSFFINGETFAQRQNPVFKLAAGDDNPDNRYFTLINGSHLIGRQKIYEGGQAVYQVVVSTTLEDGTVLNLPLDIHSKTAPAAPLAFAKPVEQRPETERSISPIFTPEIQHWSAEIIAWGETHRLDPDIIATLMQIESCGNPEAQSTAGAQGLFQVMPHHFDAGENMFSPNINAKRALAYYKEGLAFHGGDIDLTFAGYNAGHGTVRSADQSDWPKETQQYHYWSHGIYREAKAGLASSQTLQEWLAFGGVSLCESAAGKLGI